ncbi:MAG: bifunctional ornithine acetyltransferase/N-acetylglutamate synthase, partial [bacterium]|nr:bifunctional ornithine acetyltransferase/N-acetylglutamate synthase [bacterium]
KKDSFLNFANAIMTTDTKTKISYRKFKNSIFLCFAKGSGMIAPNMATLLSFLISDARIGYSVKNLYREIIDSTLNRITIDGDTSTNDSSLFLWNSNSDFINKKDLYRILKEIYTEISYKIVEDAEGATKVIKIEVIRAKTALEAQTTAKAVALSPLVKTAVFGRDPNWGRIYAAIGRSGNFSDRKLNIYIEGTCVFKNSKIQYIPTKIRRLLNRKFISIKIDLNRGHYTHFILTSDLSYKYVEINSSYST